MAEVNPAVLGRAAATTTEAANTLPAGVVLPDGGVKPTRRFFGGRKDATPPTEPGTAGPELSRLIQGGKKERIGITSEDRVLVANHLRDRLEVARRLYQDKAHLGFYDKLLLKDGENLLAKFEGGEALTHEEFAVGWAVLQDELIQKSSAAAREVSRQPGKFQRLKNTPLIGGIFRHYAVEETTRVGQSEAPQFTSDYIKKLRYTTQSETDIENDLVELNNLRITLEKGLGFPSNSGDWTVADFQEGSRNHLYNAVAERMDEILERGYDGRSWVELHDQDPVAAARVRQQAVQEGLMYFSPELAKAVLLAERPDADVTRITNRIAEIDKPADPEDVAAKTADKTAAETRYNAAKANYERLEGSIDAAELAVVAAKDADKEAETIYVNTQPILQAEIDQLRDSLNVILPPPVGADADAMNAYNARVDARETKILAEIKDRSLEIRRLLLDRAKKASAIIVAERKLDVLKNKDDTIKGSIAHAKKAFKEAEKDFKKKEKALKDLIEPAKDKADRKRGLEMWKSIMEADPNGRLNYEKIIANWFSQGGDEARFTQDQFADITKTGGQFRGAELLREAIFGVVKDEWVNEPENKALLRQVLSDEAIASGIVRVFRLDPPSFDLKDLLPQLGTTNQAQVGDLIRFLVKEGLRGAEKGDPYLKVSERFAKPKAELENGALGILTEDMGRVKLENMDPENMLPPRVVWEGPVKEAYAFIFGPLRPEAEDLIENTELRMRVTEEFDRGLVRAGVEVEVNQEFLKQLPEDVRTGMPGEIRRLFYDADGHLRTQIKHISERRVPISDISALKELKIPQWVIVSDPDFDGGPGRSEKFQERTSEGMLARLGNDFSPELPTKLSIQTANEVLAMKPEERLKVINGFPDLYVTFNMVGAGPVDSRIRVDNRGNIWIGDPATGDEDELGEYFERREADFRGNRQSLTTAERRALQQEFEGIQRDIGRQILERQQVK